MNLQQLKIVIETAKQNFNLTEVANTLFTSQSGISKHIKDLEDELGIELFVRKGKRFLGLTEPGKELIQIAERMLLDAKNIKKLADQFSQSDHGQLTIATTHTQARYALPEVIRQFKNAFPKVLKVIVNGLHRDELSLQIRIFKKTNDLRKIWENLTGVTFTEDMEVWPTWNLEKEILNDDVLKKQFEI